MSPGGQRWPQDDHRGGKAKVCSANDLSSSDGCHLEPISVRDMGIDYPESVRPWTALPNDHAAHHQGLFRATTDDDTDDAVSARGNAVASAELYMSHVFTYKPPLAVVPAYCQFDSIESLLTFVENQGKYSALIYLELNTNESHLPRVLSIPKPLRDLSFPQLLPALLANQPYNTSPRHPRAVSVYASEVLREPFRSSESTYDRRGIFHSLEG